MRVAIWRPRGCSQPASDRRKLRRMNLIDLMKPLGLALFCAAVLSAQSSSTKGKELFDRAIAALGGDRFLHMQNRMESGRVYAFFREQISGLDVAKIYTEYL